MSASNVAANFGPAMRVRRENANLTQAQVAAAAGLPPETLEAIESARRSATDTEREAIRRALARLEPCPPTCLRLRCQQTGGGELAVRAFMAGDDSAAAKLSRAVVAVLAVQRAAMLRKRGASRVAVRS